MRQDAANSGTDPARHAREEPARDSVADGAGNTEGAADTGHAEPTSTTGTIGIDCDDCAVRGPGCGDCVVSVLLGVPDVLSADEQRALEVLADAGMAPRLRLVPVHRKPGYGVA